MISSKGRGTAIAALITTVALFSSQASCDPAPRPAESQIPFDYASVIEGATTADGTAAFLVNEGGMRQRLFVRAPQGVFVHLRVTDTAAKLSFDQLHDLSLADDGSLLLLMADVSGEGAFPVQCRLSANPACELVRIEGAVAREARLLDGGRLLLAVPFQAEGDFAPRGAVLLDTSTGKLTKIAPDLYVESILSVSRSTALLKIAEVDRGSPTFGVVRLHVKEGRVAEIRRGLP